VQPRKRTGRELEAQRQRPQDKVVERFGQAQRGEEVQRTLGATRVERQHGRCVPTTDQAEAASKFRGKVQQGLAISMIGGKVMQTTVELVSQDVALKWRPKTQADKMRATINFQAFLVAVGLLELVFPANEMVPEKTEAQTGLEEDCLTGFALNRAMAGQGMSGIYTVISHVRTWYETKFHAPLGRVRKAAKCSPTSEFIRSLAVYFPVKDDNCKKRKPMTADLVRKTVTTTSRWGIPDVGVAVATAFAGLYRVGELTATGGTFDPAEDMTESDALFLPSFWKATRVEIRLGRSKADQNGEKSKLRPRVLPVDDDDDRSPGRPLRDMLAERHSVRRGRAPLLGARPLFQDKKGGQLKQSAVLDKLRKVLLATGMTAKEAAECGTHSCRIGGATVLFQLGASPEVIKRMGGWSSEAYKLHVLVQQRDLMAFSRRMCRNPNRTFEGPEAGLA
jgi:hypothetical protein